MWLYSLLLWLHCRCVFLLVLSYFLLIWAPMCSCTILRLSHGKIYHVRAPPPCFHTTNNGGLGTGIMSRWLCNKFAAGSLTPQFWQLCNHPPFTISDLKTFPCGSVSCVSHCQLQCRSGSLSGVGSCVKLWNIQALLPCTQSQFLTWAATAHVWWFT